MTSDADDDAEGADGRAGAEQQDTARLTTDGGSPASAESRLLAMVREAIAEPRHLTLDEVADRAAVDRDELRRLFDVMERLHPDGYRDRDVDYAKGLALLRQHYPMDILVRSARQRARAVTSIVVNDLATVRQEVLRPLVEDGTDTESLGQQLSATAGQLVPTVSELMTHDYYDILLGLLDTEAVAQASRAKGDAVNVSIGFVDLVGYTRLSASVDPQGLSEVLEAFEALVSAVTHDTDVMVVKYIGDAAMLLASDADALVRCLLEVVTAEDRGLDDVARRAGVGSGEVVVRDGDYFGPAVNMAARLTDLARPGSLVADKESIGRIHDGWELSRLPPLNIHGVGRKRPFRIRPPRQDEES